MNTLKKLVEFIRSKLGTAMAKNLSIEDQYTQAASTLIDKITELQTAHVKSVNEEKRIRELANEKDQLAASKEREIRKLIADGASPMTAFEDILDDLGIPRLQEAEVMKTLGQDEIRIYQALAEGGEMTADELCRRTGKPVSHIHALVTIMEMKGVLWTSLGKIFIAK